MTNSPANKARVIVIGKPFKPSLIVVSEVNSLFHIYHDEKLFYKKEIFSSFSEDHCPPVSLNSIQQTRKYKLVQFQVFYRDTCLIPGTKCTNTIFD